MAAWETCWLLSYTQKSMKQRIWQGLFAAKPHPQPLRLHLLKAGEPMETFDDPS